jgi:hypothetical protein
MTRMHDDHVDDIDSAQAIHEFSVMSHSSQPIEVSSDEGSSHDDRKVTRKPTIAKVAKQRRKREGVSIDATLSIRLHSESYHDVNELVTCQQDLLNWFENEK